MRNRSLVFAFCQLLILLVASPQVSAQNSVCLTLANNLKPDVLNQGSSTEQFAQLQQLVSDNTYSSWANASNSSLNGGINIPEELDAFLNTKSDASNWGVNRANFLAMNAQTALSNATAFKRLSQVNVKALSLIVNCAQETANAKGFQQYYKQYQIIEIRLPCC